MREWPDRLDEMLDGALASYSEAPGIEGLERRVLAKVNQRTMHRRPLRRWAIAATGVAAAVCCLFWLEMPKTTIQPYRAITTASTSIPAPALQVPPLAIKAARATTIRRSTPKLPRFPTPSPMSSEERALLRLATGDPKNIPRELTSVGNSIEPLQIAAIEIKPLE
jgi:hypothetical protein